MKDLTVIIPMYNAATTIGRSLGSLKDQTIEKDSFEVIVVDDGSEDASIDIVKDFIQSNELNIQIICKSNGGVSSARNTGIEAAETKYISFLDSDDTYNKMTISLLLENVSCNKLLIGKKEVAYENKVSKSNLTSDESLVLNSDVDSLEYLMNKGIFNDCTNKIYNLEKLKINNILFDERIEVSEDFIFNLEYFQKVDEIEVLDYTFVNYYVEDSYLTKKVRKDEFNNRSVPLNILEKYYQKHGVKKDLSLQYLKIFYSDLYHTMRLNENLNNRINELLTFKEIQRIVTDFKPESFQSKVMFIPIKLNSNLLIKITMITMFKIKNLGIKKSEISSV